MPEGLTIIIADTLRLLLSNFTVVLLVLGFLVSAVWLMLAPKPLLAAEVVEALSSPFMLFSVGVSYFLNFVFHVFFGKQIAGFIGWPDSPFQAEVGYASLGFAIIGLLAWRGSFDFRIAAVLGVSAFLLGAAGTHIYSIVTTENFAPGNAGAILYTDIGIPVVGFILLWLQHRYGAATPGRP